jgi:hypothetical protein
VEGRHERHWPELSYEGACQKVLGFAGERAGGRRRGGRSRGERHLEGGYTGGLDPERAVVDGRPHQRQPGMGALRDHPAGRVDHHPAPVVPEPEAVQVPRRRRETGGRLDWIDVEAGQSEGQVG